MSHFIVIDYAQNYFDEKRGHNILLSIFPVCELLSVRLEQLESVEDEFQVRLLCLKARSREIEDRQGKDVKTRQHRPLF